MVSVYSMHKLTKTLNKLAGFEKEVDDDGFDQENYDDIGEDYD
jgi:hypothetical protein